MSSFFSFYFQFNLNDFLRAWQESVPEGMKTSLTQIEVPYITFLYNVTETSHFIFLHSLTKTAIPIENYFYSFVKKNFKVTAFGLKIFDDVVWCHFLSSKNMADVFIKIIFSGLGWTFSSCKKRFHLSLYWYRFSDVLLESKNYVI